jgi:hypothetical protein
VSCGPENKVYYVSLLDNICYLGTHRSPLPHCHDTHAMQNLSGCVTPYLWWLEMYKITWRVTVMFFCGSEMNCIQKTLQYNEFVYPSKGESDFF